MSELATYKLAVPVIHAGKTYSELTFRGATLGDMILTDAVSGEMAKTAVVLAAMASVPYDVIKAVSFRDVDAMMQAAAPLMGNAQPAAISGDSSSD